MADNNNLIINYCKLRNKRTFDNSITTKLNFERCIFFLRVSVFTSQICIRKHGYFARACVFFYIQFISAKHISRRGNGSEKRERSTGDQAGNRLASLEIQLLYPAAAGTPRQCAECNPCNAASGELVGWARRK